MFVLRSIVFKSFIVLLLLVSAGAQELKIAAASDLSAALQKINPLFEKQTGIHVSVSLGSSGNFFAQIRSGAPFDCFLSADRDYAEKLEEAGQGEHGTVTLYARGRLALWTPSSSKLKFSLDNLKTLASSAVKKISIANPEHAPYGRAAMAALQHYGIYDQVKARLVLGENVSQAAQFAQSGNADVALIALSLALSDSMKRSGQYVLLPQESHRPLDQAGVVLHSSKNKQQARRFLQFLMSADGQKILKEFGFENPRK